MKAVGGVKCPPNMSRILYQWGLQKKLEKYGTRCPEISYRVGECSGFPVVRGIANDICDFNLHRPAITGESIGAMHFNDAIVKELGAGLFFMSVRIELTLRR